VRSVSEAVREGQTVRAKVQTVDEEGRRISLSIKALAYDPNYTGALGDAEPEPDQPQKKRKRPLRGGLE